MATDLLGILINCNNSRHTKMWDYPQCCGKLIPQYSKVFHRAVENSKGMLWKTQILFHILSYLWKTLLAIMCVPLALLAHEGNIKKNIGNPLCATL